MAELTAPTSFPALAEAVVRRVEPRELVLLPEATERWLTGGAVKDRDDRWLGGSIGSGLTPDLVTLVVYPVLAGAFAPLLEKSATGGFRAWRRRRRARHPEPIPQVPPLTASQLEAVHTRAVETAVAAGTTQQRARLIADAVVGALVHAANVPPDPHAGDPDPASGP